MHPWMNARRARPSGRTARLGEFPPLGRGTAARLHAPAAASKMPALTTKQAPLSAVPTRSKRPSFSLTREVAAVGPNPASETGDHVWLPESKIWLAVTSGEFVTLPVPTTSTRPPGSDALTVPPTIFGLVKVHVPDAAWYSSAEVSVPTRLDPPAASTLPEGSRIAVWSVRGSFIFPVTVPLPAPA